MAEHGTTPMYHRGCRCQKCRDEIARYERHRRYDMERHRARVMPSTGTVRRLEGLAAMGWSLRTLSVRLGLVDTELAAMRRHAVKTGRVFRSTAEKIAALYDELSMIPGDSSVTRKRAQAKGWHPPLAWVNIDDPDEDPSKPTLRDKDIVDEVVVDRVLAGAWQTEANAAERTEVTRRWFEAGRSRASLERASKWNVAFYMKRAGLTKSAGGEFVQVGNRKVWKAAS